MIGPECTDDKVDSVFLTLRDKNGFAVKHVINASNNTVTVYQPKYDTKNLTKLLPLVLDHKWTPYEVNGKVFKMKYINIGGAKKIQVYMPDGTTRTVAGNTDPSKIVHELTKALMSNG